MTDLILYSDGTPDCLEANRLLVGARLAHLVHPNRDFQPELLPVLYQVCVRYWTGLDGIREYLRMCHPSTKTPTPEQPPNHPPHDDHAYARIACAARQGHSI